MSKFASGWYLIYTRIKHEKKVALRLNLLDVNYYLPTQKKLRNWHDRKKYIDAPLFPCYLFVYMPDMDSYFKVHQIEGVLYFVKRGKELVKIPESQIFSIKAAVEHGKELEVIANDLPPGMEIEIAEGPLAGISAELIHFKNENRLLVRIALLGQHIVISVPSKNTSFSLQD